MIYLIFDGSVKKLQSKIENYNFGMRNERALLGF